VLPAGCPPERRTGGGLQVRRDGSEARNGPQSPPSPSRRSPAWPAYGAAAPWTVRLPSRQTNHATRTIRLPNQGLFRDQPLSASPATQASSRRSDDGRAGSGPARRRRTACSGRQRALGIRPSNESDFFHLSLYPGAALEATAIVTNHTQSPVTLLNYPVDATSTPQGAFALANQDEPRPGVGGWVQLNGASITVAANSELKVPFRISVPAGTPLGDYAGGLIIQAPRSGAKPPPSTETPPSVWTSSSARGSASTSTSQAPPSAPSNTSPKPGGPLPPLVTPTVPVGPGSRSPAATAMVPPSGWKCRVRPARPGKRPWARPRSRQPG
jgi:hypothetical protein